MEMTAKPITDLLLETQRKEIEYFTSVLGRAPTISIFADMGHEPSAIYVTKKTQWCSKVGVDAKIETTRDICAEVPACKSDGIIVQLPQPDCADVIGLLKSIPPEKDIDGLNPINFAYLCIGRPAFIPCTALAVYKMLRHYDIDVEGKKCVIVNDSVVFGKPMAMLLNKNKATVTLCNKYTEDMTSVCKNSDVLITAVGSDKFSITEGMTHGNQVVIDVAIRRDGKLIKGDFPPELRGKVKAYSALPGGVGPITVACVVENLITSLQRGEV